MRDAPHMTWIHVNNRRSTRPTAHSVDLNSRQKTALTRHVTSTHVKKSERWLSWSLTRLRSCSGSSRRRLRCASSTSPARHASTNSAKQEHVCATCRTSKKAFHRFHTRTNR